MMTQSHGVSLLSQLPEKALKGGLEIAVCTAASFIWLNHVNVCTSKAVNVCSTRVAVVMAPTHTICPLLVFNQYRQLRVVGSVSVSFYLSEFPYYFLFNFHFMH